MNRSLRSILVLCVTTLLLAHCGGRQGKQELSILIRMMPAQERFLRQQIIPKFESENNCKVNVATFDNEWDIPKFLTLEQGKKNGSIDLVKVPFEMTRPLVWQNLISPLTEIEDSNVIMKDMAEYHQLASGLGWIDGKPYYVPRKLETRILFYRKSLVDSALAKFEGYRDRINSDLKKINGYGLPKDYQLETDPSLWDLFDVYAIGSVWAQEEYNGVKMGRIAQRSAPYGGTSLTLVDKAIGLGATEQEILSMANDKVADVLAWEKLFVKNNIYNSSMWQDKWKGADLYNGIKDGKVFMTYLQQIDCFNVHGWADDPGMPGYLPLPDDMGLAVMPQMVSLKVTADGVPAVVGTRTISTGGWWWGIPKTSAKKNLAYKFAQFITSHDNQAKECANFGMIPVRKDLLLNIPDLFEEGWVGEIYKTSVAQINANGLTTVPLVKYFPQISQLYVDAWYKYCIENSDANYDVSGFKMKIAKDFSAKLTEATAGNESEQK